MKNLLKVAVFMIISGSTQAGDLVLKLGTTGNFRYHRVPVTGTVTISPSTGDVTIDPVAETGALGDGWCPAGTPVVGAPTFTTSLGASTSSLPVGGGAVTLTWVATNATGGCTSNAAGVSGWNGNAVTSPTTINLSSSGTYSFSVTCTNTSASASASSGPVSVTVATPPPTTACTNRPSPAGLTRQTVMTNYFGTTQNSGIANGAQVDVRNYAPLLGSSFNHASQVARVFVDSGKFVAMQFSTTGLATGAVGGVDWEASGISQGVANVLVSGCPGDFEWSQDPSCTAEGVGSGLVWKIGPKPTNFDGFCYLTANTTYYISVVFASAGNFGTTTCASGYCDWLIAIGAQR